jgi:hypothetical protein
MDDAFPRLGRDETGPIFRPGRVWLWLGVWAALMLVSVVAQAWWDFACVQVEFNGIWYLQAAGFWLGSEHAWSWLVALATGLLGFWIGFVGFIAFIFVSFRRPRLGRVGMLIMAILTVQSLAASLGHGLASIGLYEKYVRGAGLPQNSTVFDDSRIAGWQSHWLAASNALSAQLPGIAVASVVLLLTVAAASLGAAESLGARVRTGLRLPVRLIVPLGLFGILVAHGWWSVTPIMLVVFALLFSLSIMPNNFKAVMWLKRTRRAAGREDAAAYLLLLDIVIVWFCVYAFVNGLF